MPFRTDLSLPVFVSFDLAIDLKIDRSQISVAFLLPSDLNTSRTVFVVKQIHPLSDEFYRGFEQVPIQCEGSVLGHPSPGNHAKMIFQIIRRSPEAFHSRDKPIKGLFPCSGVNPLVVDLADPQIKGAIEFIKAPVF